MDPDSLTIFYSYLNLEEIVSLFKNKPDLRDKIIDMNYLGLPQINDTIIRGNIETMKYLIKEINIIPTDCQMYLACENGHLEIVKYLFKNGIKPHDAINFASGNGHLNIVKYLYKNGFKATCIGIDWAGENGYLEVVKYLHKNGIKHSSYVINWASKKGHFEMVEYLKKHKKYKKNYENDEI